SLQLRLELSQARVALLRRETELRVARLALGSRVGAAGPVDAAPLDTLLPEALPLSLDEAVALAARDGPAYRVARAAERAAAAAFRARFGEYLPKATLSWTRIGYDNRFLPTRLGVSALNLGVTFPLWDNGRRERGAHEVARAARDDAERAVRRDVTAAYDGFVTARASADLAAEGLRVARENYRVQERRYQAGATTILDLLTAQADLDDAAAALVQARYATRLAVAGLETILGRRLFEPAER